MHPEHDPGTYFPHQRAIPVLESEQIYLPRAVREPFQNIELYWIENFLSSGECDALMQLMSEHGTRSTTMEGDRILTNEFRTSYSTNLSILGDPLADEIDRRIARYMGYHPSFGEGLQGHSYDIGEEFKPHFDFASIPAETEQETGQRTWTFMVFLNNVEEGGQTEFPRLGISYTPKQGCAIAWRNLDLGGSPNPYTLHAGLPVIKGHKSIITKWFRQYGETPRYTKCAGEYLPAYSSNDMQKVKIPTEIYRKILEYKNSNAHISQIERGAEDFVKNNSAPPSSVINLTDQLRHELHVALKPILESWVQLPLQESLVYGVRRYYEGSYLEAHVDTYTTHRVSATLNIDQKLTEPWPLHVRDSYYRQHAVVLEPGEMLLYEGARLEHGRLLPLKGEYYDSAFVHYYP